MLLVLDWFTNNGDVLLDELDEDEQLLFKDDDNDDNDDDDEELTDTDEEIKLIGVISSITWL